MYAISANGYRAITQGDVLLPGETLSEIVPQSLLNQLASTESAKVANRTSMANEALSALTDLRAYRDLATPTNAQTAAIVKTLVIVAIGTIKLILGKLDTST